MCRLIESISIKNGQPQHIKWHEARMNKARKALFDLEDEIELTTEYFFRPDSFAKAVRSEKADVGWWKCRITYAQKIDKIEFEPYQIRPVHSLRLVEDNTIDYSHKYQNRMHLIQLFAQRDGCDNILIVKNGFITDSYYANVVFENEEGFFTPDTPLLEGVQRQNLLFKKEICTRSIRPENIKTYQRVHLINAFMELGDCVVDTERVLI